MEVTVTVLVDGKRKKKMQLKGICNIIFKGLLIPHLVVK